MIIVHGLQKKNSAIIAGFAFAGSNTMNNRLDALTSLKTITSSLSPQDARLFRWLLNALADVTPGRRMATCTHFLDETLLLGTYFRTTACQALGFLADLEADSFRQHLTDHSLLNKDHVAGDGSATTVTSLSASDVGTASTTDPETCYGRTTLASLPETSDGASGSSGGSILTEPISEMTAHQ